jgi:hypothetical protein
MAVEAMGSSLDRYGDYQWQEAFAGAKLVETRHDHHKRRPGCQPKLDRREGRFESLCINPEGG